MKISIHILSYNYDPQPILRTLLGQLDQDTTDWSITIWDDGSKREFKTQLNHLQDQYRHYDFLHWQRCSLNTGRAAMRQKILHNSTLGWQVSIDADMVPDEDFTAQLKLHLADPGVIYQGQHYYQELAPPPTYRLHWKYGTHREIKRRNQSNSGHFFTGIFAWHSSVASRLYFDTNIQTYGHEDTIFGQLLRTEGIPVETIPARALHRGLMSTDAFIKKQREAVHNIRILQAQYPEYTNRLILWANRIEKWTLVKQWIVREKTARFCIQQLHRSDPPLAFLDLLKLHEYFRILES